MGRRLTCFAAAVVVALLAAPAAEATVIDKGHYESAYTDAYEDCGFPVDVAGMDSGHFRIRAGKGKNASVFFVNDNYAYRERSSRR